MIQIDQLKQLRGDSGVSISECKKALESAGGDIEKAKHILKEWGKEVAEKKQERQTGEGFIESYVHGTGKVGTLLVVRCETDFVARSADFKNFCHELALQIVSMNPETVEVLLEQPYIKESSKQVKDLLRDSIAKLGENIVVEKFARFQI